MSARWLKLVLTAGALTGMAAPRIDTAPVRVLRLSAGSDGGRIVASTLLACEAGQWLITSHTTPEMATVPLSRTAANVTWLDGLAGGNFAPRLADSPKHLVVAFDSFEVIAVGLDGSEHGPRLRWRVGARPPDEAFAVDPEFLVQLRGAVVSAAGVVVLRSDGAVASLGFKSGKPQWRTRIRGLSNLSLHVANGLVAVLGSRAGRAEVVFINPRTGSQRRRVRLKRPLPLLAAATSVGLVSVWTDQVRLVAAGRGPSCEIEPSAPLSRSRVHLLTEPRRWGGEDAVALLSLAAPSEVLVHSLTPCEPTGSIGLPGPRRPLTLAQSRFLPELDGMIAIERPGELLLASARRPLHFFAHPILGTSVVTVRRGPDVSYVLTADDTVGGLFLERIYRAPAGTHTRLHKPVRFAQRLPIEYPVGGVHWTPGRLLLVDRHTLSTILLGDPASAALPAAQ